MPDSGMIFPPAFRVTTEGMEAVAGGSIEVYLAGTNTTAPVYSDSTLTTSLGATIYLDSGGHPVASSGSSTKVSVYTGTALVKLVFKDANGVTLSTYDNLKLAQAAGTGGGSVDGGVGSVITTAHDVTVTALDDDGNFYNIDPTGGNRSVYLPDDAADGFEVGFRHNGSTTTNAIIIDAVGDHRIYRGSTEARRIVLKRGGETVRLVSNGVDWYCYGDTPADITEFPIRVADRVSAPPTSPSPGAYYIVTASPTLAWAAYAEHDLAKADGNGGWIRIRPYADCGWIAYVQDENVNYQYQGAEWVAFSNITAPTETTLGVFTAIHQVADGTGGGAIGASNGTFYTRTLNTTLNAGTGVLAGASLSANKITNVPAGTYQWNASASFRASTDYGQARIRGTNRGVIAYLTNSVLGTTSVGAGVFTLTDVDDIYIENAVSANAADTSAGGLAAGITGVPETYASLELLSIITEQGPQGEQGDQGNTGTGYYATSTTSLTIGSGVKTLTTQSNLAYAAGMSVKIVNPSDTDQWMTGTCTSYSGTTLVVTADDSNGSGTVATWNIGLIGHKGDTGTPGTTVPTIGALTAVPSGILQPTDNLIIDRSGSSYKATMQVLSGYFGRVFTPRTYLSDADWAAVQNYDTASQNASAVTAALRSMFDAMMTFVQGGSNRAAVAVLDGGAYAINDELVSASFYSAMWSQTSLGAGKAFGILGIEDRATKIVCKGFTSPVITRAAGPYSGVASHRAILPIHIDTAKNRCSWTIQNIEFVGELSITTDPVGLSTIGILDTHAENLSFDSLANTPWLQQGGFNSRFQELSIQSCGLQPVMGGVIDGARSGFPNTGATFTLTDLGSNQVQIDASTTYFAADHATNALEFFVKNGRSVSGVLHPLVCTISSYTSATRVVATYEAGTTISAGSGKPGSFGILRGSVTGTTLTLPYALDLGTEVGRDIFLPKAGSSVLTEFDLSANRITAISGDKKTITLAHAVANTVSNMPVIVAPMMYVGMTDTVGGAENYWPNDCRYDMVRLEYSLGYNSALTSAVGFVGQGLRICDFDRSKTHGASQERGNFGAGAINTILDDSEVSIDGHHFTWGNWNSDKGSVWVMGLRSKIIIDDAAIAHWRSHNKERIFYIDPQTSSEAVTKVVVSGRMEASHHNAFPNQSQALFAYGANGSARMVQANGPLVSENDVLRTVTPPYRGRVEAQTAVTSSTVARAVTSETQHTGTPAAGIGGGYAIVVETASGTFKTIGAVDAVTTDVTSSSEDADLALSGMAAGVTTELMRLKSDKRIGVGTAGIAGYSLALARPLTGATTSVGYYQGGAVQSDVTSQATSFSTFMTTAASAFTLSTMFHYRAAQGTIGAGSAVTMQYGFAATSTLTGATNNYGFYSDLADATGRWNFYANGTASNYFAGPIEVGHTSDTTLARSGAGDLSIEGNVIYRAGGTDVPIADGGTGASTAQAACKNLGAEWGGSTGTLYTAPADTSEHTAWTLSIPAGAIGANGRIMIALSATGTNSANSKTIRIKLGGTTVRTIIFTANNGFNDLSWLINTNSQSANKMFAGASPLGAHNSSYNSFTIDTSVANDLTITLQKATAGETLELVHASAAVMYSA